MLGLTWVVGSVLGVYEARGSHVVVWGAMQVSLRRAMVGGERTDSEARARPLVVYSEL